MMRRLFLVVVLLLLIANSLQSQNVTYRLNDPNINEYLEVIPAVLETYSTASVAALAKNPHHPMVDIISNEINFRYAEVELSSLSYDTLSTAYDALVRYAPCCRGLAFRSSDTWLSPIVEAWVRENVETIPEMADYRDDVISISITPLNLDIDEESEYQLTIYITDSEYTTYFLDIESTNPPIYRLEILPFGWYSYNLPSSDEIETRMLDDINDDGVVDWVIFASSYYNFQSCGSLYVLNWSHGQLVDLLDFDSYLCEPEPIEFLNLDEDAALEIHQSEYRSNNWFCVWHQDKTFDWNGIEYHLSDTTEIFDEILGCAMHDAEPLMWENQWAEAILIYERGLELGWENYSGTVETIRLAEMTQYAKVRLVLAYWLAGRDTEAENLFNELQADEPLSEMMSTLIEALADAHSNVLAQCTAAYNVFWEYRKSMFNYELPSNIEVGYMDYVIRGSPPQPERAGCNAPLLIDSALSEMNFHPDVSPITILENAEIEVENYLEADLNSDGVSDWLIWLTAKAPPVLLLSDDNGEYYLSRPDVRRPDENVEVSTIQTLDTSSLWITDYVYLPEDTYNVVLGRYNIESFRCEDSDADVTTGNLQLWRVHNNTLELAINMPLCQERTIDEIFQEEGILTGWATIAVHDPNTWDKVFGEAIYMWDEEAQNYFPPKPEIIADTTSEPPERSIFEASGAALGYFQDGDYAVALSLLDETIAGLDVETPDWIVEGLQYYRALNLEALGCIDEAVTVYQALAEVESAWGMLAGLHIEPINP